MFEFNIKKQKFEEILVNYKTLLVFVKVLGYYVFSLGLMYVAYKLLIVNELVLYVFLFLILTGLLLDSRVEKKRKFLFSIFLGLHLVF